MRAGSSDGQISVATFVQHDELDAGLKALLTATRRLAKDGLTEHELYTAKRAQLERLELRLESNAEVAEALSDLLAFGDPAQRLPQIRAQVVAITLGDVKRAAARYLAGDARVVLVAGPHRRGDPRLWRLSDPTFYSFE